MRNDWCNIFPFSAMRNLSRSASNTPESSLLSSASYNTAYSLSFATAQNVQQEVTLSPATQNQRHHQHRQPRHHDFVPIDSVDGKLQRCRSFYLYLLASMQTLHMCHGYSSRRGLPVPFPLQPPALSVEKPWE